MKDLFEIRKFIETHAVKEDLVLCTLIRKSGSAYRGVGSKKVVSRKKGSLGMLSGGCLEGAIDTAARERFDELPFVKSFSTLAEEDRLMGYQTGCQGVIEVLFEKIPAREGDEAEWRKKIDLLIPFGHPVRARGVALQIGGPCLGYREFIDSNRVSEEEIFEEWFAPVHAVIIGCGADADAYLPLFKSMGWSFQLMDYRRDLVKADRFFDVQAEHWPLEDLAAQVPQGDHVAVILMTHNYEADLEIVRGLRHHHLGYLGSLGPARRFERLQKDLQNFYGETLSEEFKSIVSAPIGLFPHSSSPETIALSAVAQIQQKLVETRRENVWTMILAAGASKRFGGVKALAEWQGKTFISRALTTAKTFSGSSTLVVTGGHAEALKPHLSGAETVFNEQWSEGMGTSISRGVRAIVEKDPTAGFVVVLPVDQPFVEAEHLEKLLNLSRKSGRCVLTEGDNFMGPPAVIPRAYFENAQTLNGERGLKSILKSSDISTVPGVRASRDIDTVAEFI